MDTVERVRGLVAPVVAAVNAELYDLELAGGVLRITVDRPIEGVGIDLIGRLTRDISHILDEADPIPGQYTLEVSSPGLERTLRRPEHFARAVGSLVSLKTRAGVEGERRLTGELVAADDLTVTVAVRGAEPGEHRRLAYDDLERARTVFEWGPAPKPGGRPAASPSAKQNQKKKAAQP